MTLAAEEVCFARYSVWDHSCLVEGCQSLDLMVVENRIHNWLEVASVVRVGDLVVGLEVEEQAWSIVANALLVAPSWKLELVLPG